VPRAARRRFSSHCSSCRRTAAAALGVGIIGFVVADPASLPALKLSGRDRLLHLNEGAFGSVAVVDHNGHRRIKLNNFYVLGGTQTAGDERGCPPRTAPSPCWPALNSAPRPAPASDWRNGPPCRECPLLQCPDQRRHDGGLGRDRVDADPVVVPVAEPGTLEAVV
jgi:hypothetical protein